MLAHVRAGGGRLLPEPHVGLHMGAILIQLANGIESCFQYRDMTGSV